MLGNGQPLECVALFNALKSTQNRYVPFFFGVNSIWDHAGASDGLIMLQAIALRMNCSTSYVLAIVCHRGGCLFLSVIHSLSGFKGMEYGSTSAAVLDSSVLNTLVYLYTTFSNLDLNSSSSMCDNIDCMCSSIVFLFNSFLSISCILYNSSNKLSSMKSSI